MLFFRKLPNVRFWEHFLQISHDLRTINGQINISGEKPWKLDTRKTVSNNEKWICILTRLSDNLPKLEHHAGVKTEQMNYENSPQPI